MENIETTSMKMIKQIKKERKWWTPVGRMHKLIKHISYK